MGACKQRFGLYASGRGSNSVIKASVAHDGSKIFIALHVMTDWSFLKPYDTNQPRIRD